MPKLVDHIQTCRGRFESSIRIEYLERLNRLYEAWIERYDLGPRLIVDVGEHDFVNELEDRTDVIARVESRLFGLFPES